MQAEQAGGIVKNFPICYESLTFPALLIKLILL